MCGHIQRMADHPMVKILLEVLNIQLDLPLRSGNFYPGGTLDGVIIDQQKKRRSIEAVWWFLLDEHGKPDYRFATFNARHLDSKLWKSPIHHHRCAIIATGIGESKGEGKAKQSFLMQADEPFLLGGVYRAYRVGGELTFGVSVITRDPHPRFSQYHDKAVPLFLPADTEFIGRWLDPEVTDLSEFSEVLERPRIRVDLQVTPVQSTKKLIALGEAERLEKD